MKYNRKNIFISIFWVVLGVVLTVLNFIHDFDSYWSGLGTAFIVVGGIQLARQMKYRKNPEYRERVDTANSDERNRFIAGKAWAWAGYIYVMAGFIVIIVLQIAGLKELSQTIGFTVCALLILYWVCYLYLSKKY